MIQGQDKPSLDELAHFGVRGMQWGVRKQRKSGSGPSSSKSREAVKAERMRQHMKENQAIDNARSRVNSGQTRLDYKTAKAKYKREKKTIGRAAAKQHLNQAKVNRNREVALANTAKHGAEKTAKILVSVGAIALGGIAGGVRASGYGF